MRSFSDLLCRPKNTNSHRPAKNPTFPKMTVPNPKICHFLAFMSPNFEPKNCQIAWKLIFLFSRKIRTLVQPTSYFPHLPPTWMGRRLLSGLINLIQLKDSLNRNIFRRPSRSECCCFFQSLVLDGPPGVAVAGGPVALVQAQADHLVRQGVGASLEFRFWKCTDSLKFMCCC